MAPRSFVAKLKHASFLSTTPRCLEKMTDGPGKYKHFLFFESYGKVSIIKIDNYKHTFIFTIPLLNVQDEKKSAYSVKDFRFFFQL